VFGAPAKLSERPQIPALAAEPQDLVDAPTRLGAVGAFTCRVSTILEDQNLT
jgi:hypothetical protein